MALGKGIPVINGFDLNSKLPLDSRTVADTKENMNKLVTDGSVGDGQLCYCKADKKLYVLKEGAWSEVGEGGGGGQAMFDIFQYVDDETMTMTEEGYNLLYDGLRSGKYAGIVFGYWNAYPICIDDTYSLRFQYINFEPDSPNDIYKMLIIDKNTKKISGLPWDEGSQNAYMYLAFYTKPYIEGGTSSLPYYNAETSEQQNLTIGDGLAIENGVLKATGGSGGSSKIWYELPSLFFLENITQEQFDEIKNLALQNQLAGINCAGLYCPLIFYNDGQNITFFYPWYENDIFTAQLIILNTDLSVKKTPYSTITLPQTAPTSQLIPSITTSNTQQNLTIGNGLEIKNGALQATGGGGGGKSVPPTLNLVDLDSGDFNVRTTITEEEKTNLENGLYNQVIFPGSILDLSDFLLFMPSKLIGDKSFSVNSFAQFNCVMNNDTITINALSLYSYSFGAKDTSGNYPITIEKSMDIPIGGSGGSGGGDIWYEISSISNSTITQDQYNELTNLINADKLAGIRVNNEGYFTLFTAIDGNYIFVGYNMSIGLHYANISPDLSTKESYTQLVMFNEKPTSQVIPSFSPIHNAQENLTIGDGLTIENGVLKATGSGGSNVTVTFED